MTTAALVAVLVASGAPQASQPASDLAFQSGRTGDFDLYRAAAGGGESNLTASPEPDLDPAWSPNGNRIAFARVPAGERRPSIYLMNANGSGLVRLTNSNAADRHPAWSPGGDWLAFVRSFPPEGRSQIWKIRPNGSGVTKLTGTGPGTINGSPVWYHDGLAERIAFTRAITGASFPSIRRIDAGSGGNGKLLSGDGTSIHANPDWGVIGGQGTLAFELCCPGGGGDLAKVDDKGTGPFSFILQTPTTDEADPAVSAETPSRLAYARAPTVGGDRDVYTTAADGSGAPVRVTSDPRADLSPDWEPLPAPTPATAASASLDAAPQGERHLAGATSSGAGKKKKKKRRKVVVKVAPGVRLLKIRRPGPIRVFALRVNPRKQPAMDLALAKRRLAGLQRTGSMARQHGALAAVNGDFALPGGKPAHAFAEDGDLKQTSFMTGPTFAMRRNEKKTFVGTADLTVTSIETSTGDRISVDRWNDGAPVYGEIAGYTAAGRGIENPAGYECSARLAPTGPRRFVPGKKGVVRDYAVQQAGCFAAPLVPIGQEVVLTAWAGSHEAFLVRSLAPGEAVAVTWSLGWSGVLEGIGGFPLLVAGGRVVVGPCGDPICGRHPRTGIGVTRRGRILLVVVDGRRPKWSKGMFIGRFAREMRKLGASFAMNLDGGGSSTMVVRKKVVNRPSGGKQRRVSSAVLVLPRDDPGDAFASTGLASEPSARAGFRVPGIADPASTGGFLDAVRRGTFGEPVGLSPELRRALRAFRSGLSSRP